MRINNVEIEYGLNVVTQPTSIEKHITIQTAQHYVLCTNNLIFMLHWIISTSKNVCNAVTVL